MHFEPQPVDNNRLAHLCGPMDENLRQISAALDVTLFRRGERFIVSGANAERAVACAKRGIRFLAVGSDLAFLRAGPAAQIKTLKG